MLDPFWLTVLLALGATVIWGSGDFCGGWVVKRYNVYSLLLSAQLISLLPFLALVISFESTLPHYSDVLIGIVASLGSMFGLLNLYQGLAHGRMYIVAPITGMIACIVPVGMGILIDGLLSGLTLMGFAFALLAVWLLSGGGYRLTFTSIELRFSVLAGGGFALFLISMDQLSGDTILWPVWLGRVASVLVLALYTLRRRYWQPPSRSLLPVITVVGLCDLAGNYYFTLATQTGRLDIAVVVASLYPAITVVLAWLILREPLKQSQWLGLLAALFSIALIVI